MGGKSNKYIYIYGGVIVCIGEVVDDLVGLCPLSFFQGYLALSLCTFLYIYVLVAWKSFSLPVVALAPAIACPLLSMAPMPEPQIPHVGGHIGRRAL